MSLFINTTSPTADFKDSSLEKAITGMAMKLAMVRSQGNLPEGPGLDINFLVSTKDDNPGFTGMRMGNYGIDQNILHFERAVPVELLNSNSADDFVKAVLQDVVVNASYFFKELKVDFDLYSWKQTLDTLN